MTTPYGLGYALSVPLGPFLDDADVKTAETGLAGTMTVKLMKYSSGTPTWAARSSADAITHTEDGWYLVPLNATDLGTGGPLIIKATASGALPVWRELDVVNYLWDEYKRAVSSLWATLTYPSDDAEVDLDPLRALLEDANALTNLLNFFTATGYDAANSAVGSVSDSVNVGSVGGSATAATNLKAFFDGTGYNASASAVGTVGSVTGAATANVTQLGGSATALAKLTALLAGTTTGSAIAGTLSTTEMTTNLTETTDNHWKPPHVVKWITGNLAGQGRAVTGYVGATKKLQYAATTEAPAAADQFIIL
jgi:hypothetical protein